MTLLAWDKEKHTILVGLELKMHNESLVVQVRMGTTIVDALKSVGNSFTSFAEVLALRL